MEKPNRASQPLPSTERCSPQSSGIHQEKNPGLGVIGGSGWKSELTFKLLPQGKFSSLPLPVCFRWGPSLVRLCGVSRLHTR